MRFCSIVIAGLGSAGLTSATFSFGAGAGTGGVGAGAGVGASANFRATTSSVDNQLFALGGSIDAIRGIAESLGHTRISNRCYEARGHISAARSAWNGISLGFLSAPWHARSSSHATTVKRRLSSCGSTLNWIYSQPETRHPAYAPHISNCKNTYSRCQSGCNSVWNWPTPPSNGGYTPTPSSGYSSGYYQRRHKREESSSCPLSETACPIFALSENFECLDTQSELTSCGGCVSEGNGENCLEIPGAQGVGCQQGACVVFSVIEGFLLNEDGRPILRR